MGLEKGTAKQQLKSFGQRLSEYGDDIKNAPGDWFEAFLRLDKILSPWIRCAVLQTGKRLYFLMICLRDRKPKKDRRMIWKRNNRAKEIYF